MTKVRKSLSYCCIIRHMEQATKLKLDLVEIVDPLNVTGIIDDDDDETGVRVCACLCVCVCVHACLHVCVQTAHPAVTLMGTW